MKRFMYVSIGIFCLALSALIGFHIGQGTAGAHSSTFFRVVGPEYVTIGESAYQVGGTSTPIWYLVPNAALLPVPVSSLAYFDEIVALTDEGEGFVYQRDGWKSLGMIPGGPTPVTPTTWGAIKALNHK
ncbi:MAG: hypothetical protein V1846_00710 [Candidatus Komeilibacteria bacterium]